MLGHRGNDQLIRREGDDTLAGGGHDDHLSGCRGADRLDGGAGVDTFIYNRDDGHDTIANYDGTGTRNKLALGAEIDKDDLSFAHLGNHLIIRTDRKGDQLTVENYFYWCREYDLEDIEIGGQAMSLSSELATVVSSYAAQTGYTDRRALPGNLIETWADTSTLQISIELALENKAFCGTDQERQCLS